MATIDAEIREYYETQGEEDSRLDGDPLERFRVRELLSRFLPPAPAVVLDVGGASGAHAFWLAERGYAVHLSDPVPLHIEQARDRARAASAVPESMTEADIRDLGHPDASVDAVVAIGPLYHLAERAQRIAALTEVARVLRPGGIAVVVGIPRFTTLFDGLYFDMYTMDDYRRGVRDTIESGVHRNEGNRRGRFTTAYLHRPDELCAEVAEVGLRVTGCLGIEGPERLSRFRGDDGYLADPGRWWADPVHREALLEAVRSVESEPSLLGLSAHFMVVATR